jgi:signal transduction histidine kinase
LIEDALILDRAESGKLEFQPVEMDAIAYCQELSSELDWDDHVLHLTVEGEASGLFDPRLLNALFTNLVYNAYKYSDIGTTVLVRLQGVEGTFILEVEDQGIGIPAEDIPRIFESYFRATNAESLPGTGVGLAIVSKCVNLHGGAIAVESAVGAGTTFRVALPLRHGTP